MREFYFKNKGNNKAYRGVMPNNDMNCPPFDYFRLLHAEICAKNFAWQLSVKCPIPIPETQVTQFVLERVDEQIASILSKTTPNPGIHQLFSDDSLNYKQQNKLLKDITLGAAEILWLNKEAQDLGYLLDVYHEEVYPVKFNEKKRPLLFNQNDDGSIEKFGPTDMTDGEMRALLEQRKVVHARIYHRSSHWHCFYYTYKGLAGEESGVMGSKPHYHYLSDKSGFTMDELLKRIKECDLPSSKVHIIIKQ